MRYRGTITVFLSLILTLILSLILAVLESAIYHAALMKTEMIADMGMDSIFAEYNRKLLSEYDLYFIDTSYGGPTPSLEEMKEHMRGFMEYNCAPAKGAPAGGLFSGGDFTGMSVKSIDILNVSYASDSTGRVFKRQAIEAVRDRYGISALNAIAEKVARDSAEYESLGYEAADMDSKQAQLEAKLEGIDYRIPENPARDVFEEKPGMLDHIIDTSGVSTKTMDISQYASHRKLNRGAGIKAPSYDPDSPVNEAFFDTYLLDKCSDYINNEGHEAASYEIEYILAGKNSDTANFRETAKRLLMVRYAADAAYIMNSEKKTEVEAVTEVIGMVLGLPPDAAKPLADLILLAWAFGESVNDLVRLLAGERVPLTKSDEDWKMPLWGLIDIKGFAKPTGSRGSGFSYEDYLRIFLFIMNRNDKVMRAMDVIEMNLRTTEGNRNFRIDGCVEYADIYVRLGSRGKYEFGIRREQSYLPDF